MTRLAIIAAAVVLLTGAVFWAGTRWQDARDLKAEAESQRDLRAIERTIRDATDDDLLGRITRGR